MIGFLKFFIGFALQVQSASKHWIWFALHVQSASMHRFWFFVPVLGSETRPDGPGWSVNSVFWPDPAKLILPGPVRATFGHFRGRPTTPSGCKSVALTTRLRPHGPDGFPGTVAGPSAGLLAWCNPRPGK